MHLVKLITKRFFIHLCIDSALWEFRRATERWIRAAELIIFCLLLNYLIWKCSNNTFSAIMNIVTLNTAVTIAYKLLGPECLLQVVWYILSFIWGHPYISAGIVSMLFISGNIYSIYQWRRGVVRREQMNSVITRMDTRLQKVEEQHKRMEKQLNVIVKQNEELKSQMAQLLSSPLKSH